MNEYVQKISLSEIRLDRETQIRAATSEETVQKYYDIMLDEHCRKTFPPILLFQDNAGKYWLADGHHRVMAAIRRNFRSIFAIVRRGTKADAVWEAAKSNGRHGLPLGHADLRRTVEMITVLLPDRSNRMIAEAIGCSEATVRRNRPANPNADTSKPEKRMGKDGRFYTVKSKKPKNNIGTKKDATAKKPSSLPESPTSEIQQMIQANVKELQIIDTISLLASQIDAWFEIAPDEEHEKFDLRIRKRILELVD